MNDIIELEVGNETFKTARSTLTSVPESLLAKMFGVESSLPPAKLQKNGAYFIESDPTIFKVILHYLRHKSIMKIPDVGMESIRTEAAYFGLTEMVELIDQEMKPAGVSKKKQEVLNMILDSDYSLSDVYDKSYTFDATGLKFKATHLLVGHPDLPSYKKVTSEYYQNEYNPLLKQLEKKGATIVRMEETALDRSDKTYSLQFELVFNSTI